MSDDTNETKKTGHYIFPNPQDPSMTVGGEKPKAAVSLMIGGRILDGYYNPVDQQESSPEVGAKALAEVRQMKRDDSSSSWAPVNADLELEIIHLQSTIEYCHRILGSATGPMIKDPFLYTQKRNLLQEKREVLARMRRFIEGLKIVDEILNKAINERK